LDEDGRDALDVYLEENGKMIDPAATRALTDARNGDDSEPWWSFRNDSGVRSLTADHLNAADIGR